MRLFILRAFLLVGLLGMCSCQKKHLPVSKKPSQTIRINFTYNPFSIDPRKCSDPITTTLCFMLYEGLTHLEPDGTVSLALAESVKISKDRKTYLFHLRPSTWSDGTPLTADHFEASWKRVLDPEFPSKTAHLLFSLKNGEKAKAGKCSLDMVGVKAIDEETLWVELEKPIPYFLELTAFCTFFPAPCKNVDPPQIQQHTAFVCNGPFKLKSWVNDDKVVVQKNPTYWNQQEVSLDEIHATIISDETTALTLFEKGELDWVGGLISPLPLDALSSLKQTSKLYQRPIAGTTFSSFNVNLYPFTNVNIRKAFAYAINRQDIVENVSQMFDDVATGPVPTVLKGTEDTRFFQDHAQELAQTHFKRGLQELGITKEEFPRITYDYFSSELQRNLAISLQGIWKKVLGIEVQLNSHELKTHITKLYNRDFQFAQMSWIGQYHDRMNFLERFSKKETLRNYSSWENPLFAQLIAESFFKERAERTDLLEKAERIITDEMPVIPLYHFHVVYVKSPSLKRVAISPMGDVQFHKAYLKGK